MYSLFKSNISRHFLVLDMIYQRTGLNSQTFVGLHISKFPEALSHNLHAIDLFHLSNK